MTIDLKVEKTARPNLRVITDMEPNASLVEMLEGILASAKAGDLRAGAFVGYTANHATLHHISLGSKITHEAIVGELWLTQFTLMVETGRIVPPGSR